MGCTVGVNGATGEMQDMWKWSKPLCDEFLRMLLGLSAMGEVKSMPLTHVWAGLWQGSWPSNPVIAYGQTEVHRTLAKGR